MDFETLRITREAAADVFCDTPVFLAFAYGSRAEGKHRPDSDLDIGYYLEHSYERADLPLFDQMVMEEALSRGTGMTVDLRNLGTAPLELRGRALENGERIYCSDERARVALETSLLVRYHDSKPGLEAMHKARLVAFAGGRV